MNINTIQENLQNALKTNNLPRALFYFFRAYKIDNNPRHLISIGDIFKDCNKYWSAIKFYEKIKSHLNLTFISNYLCMTCFPIVYKDKLERGEVLRNFNKYLSNCEHELKNKDNLKKIDKNQFLIIVNRTIFYLAYTGINIRLYQERFQKVNKILLDYFLPSNEKVFPKDQKNKDIKRIAFCARDLNKNHTVVKLFKFLMDFFVERKYEVYFFSYEKKDFYYEKNKNTYFFYGEFFQHIQLEILKHDIDLLFYLDIGMSRFNTFLSNYRIANIQIALWGHPVTSGSKSIDYFITSDLMDDKKSEDHFTEKLIFFPGFGFNYSYDHMGEYKFEMKSKELITCLQPPWKISPETISIFKKISDKINNYPIYFVGTNDVYLNKSLGNVLEKNIGKDRFYITKKLRHDEYCQLIKNSKIIIDSIGWSGGNSSLEALYYNKPIITMRGENLRSNHTSAFLKVLDLDILSCKNEEEYLNTFLRLLNNEDFYLECVDKIKKNKIKFSNQVSNQFLKNFVKKITLGDF